MTSVWKWTKEKARATEYALKNKDDVQKRVLEATRDDDDQITENEYLTIAHLSHDPAALTSIRKTLWKRFMRIQKAPVCCRKALQVLDYCVRYGNEQARPMVVQGATELQSCANSHHFTSDRPREYMAEDQCRNLVQNLLAFVNNEATYRQVRQNSEQQLLRVKSFYVQPLQVKLKPDSGVPPPAPSYNANSYNANSYNANSYNANSSYASSSNVDNTNNTNSAYNDSYNNSPPRSQTYQNYTSSSDDDEELDFDPRAMSKAKQQQPAVASPFGNQPQQQQQSSGGGYQQGQSGFNMFNQAPQQQPPNPFNASPAQPQQPNPFQPAQQPNPFNASPAQPQQNSFNQFPPPQQQQQQPPNPFNAQPAFPPQQASPFHSQPVAFPPQQQQQQSLFNSQPQQFQPPSADDLLFGPSTTQQRQQPPQQQYQPPQPDPTYDGILDFSNIPMQPAGSQQNYQNQQQRTSGGGMLDEFGDLVNLDLQKRPQRAHGRPDNLERGYNPNQNNQMQRPF